jgi:hypothetical protein
MSAKPLCPFEIPKVFGVRTHRCTTPANLNPAGAKRSILLRHICNRTPRKRSQPSDEAMPFCMSSLSFCML